MDLFLKLQGEKFLENRMCFKKSVHRLFSNYNRKMILLKWREWYASPE